MMDTNKEAFGRTWLVALYQSLTSGIVHQSTYWGEDIMNDAEVHSGYVRISEPLAVTHRPLSSDEAIQNAVASLDAEEKKARLQLEETLQRLREQRASLLALTHQTEPA